MNPAKICRTLPLSSQCDEDSSIAVLAASPLIDARRIVLLFWEHKNEYSVHTEEFEYQPIGRTTGKSAFFSGNYFKEDQYQEALECFCGRILGHSLVCT